MRKPTEVVEGRGLAKGNLGGCRRDRTQCRDALQQALDRVRQAARRGKEPCTTPMRYYYLRQEPGAVTPHRVPVSGQQYGLLTRHFCSLWSHNYR
jgi:hypothetical protein